MFEEFARLDVKHAQLLLIAFVVACGAVAILSFYWCELRKRDLEFQFKHELIERGLTVEDVERLVAVKTGDQKSGVEKVATAFADRLGDRLTRKPKPSASKTDL